MSDIERLTSIDRADRKVVQLWIDGLAPNTQRAYLGDVAALLSRIPLHRLTLEQLQAYKAELADYAPASIARKLRAIKSLCTFAHRLGAIPFNVGAALRIRGIKSVRGERIATEGDTLRAIALETDPKRRVLCRTLYVTGGRAEEIADLRWRDIQAHSRGGVVVLFGKRGKTRAVRVSPSSFSELMKLRDLHAAQLRADGMTEDEIKAELRDHPVFGISPRQIARIVKKAARRAGLPEEFSPHWFRHAHGSHAIDRGCPIHVLRETLGHESLVTTTAYVHARPSESSGLFLAL